MTAANSYSNYLIQLQLYKTLISNSKCRVVRFMPPPARKVTDIFTSVQIYVTYERGINKMHSITCITGEMVDITALICSDRRASPIESSVTWHQ